MTVDVAVLTVNFACWACNALTLSVVVPTCDGDDMTDAETLDRLADTAARTAVAGRDSLSCASCGAVQFTVTDHGRRHRA